MKSKFKKAKTKTFQKVHLKVEIKTKTKRESFWKCFQQKPSLHNRNKQETLFASLYPTRNENSTKNKCAQKGFRQWKAARKALVAKTKTKDQKNGSKKVSKWLLWWNKEAIGHRNYFVKQTKKSPRTKLNTKISDNLFCSDHSGQPRFQ